MQKLTSDQIEAAYWLAEQYLSTTKELVKDMKKKHPKIGLRKIRLEITQPRNNMGFQKCVLCVAMRRIAPNEQLGCAGCIHNITERGNCDWMHFKGTIESSRNFVEAMHERGNYIYCLLDKYHKMFND